MKTSFSILILGLFLGLFALGVSRAVAAVDQKPSAFVLCKNQKNVRTISILPTVGADSKSGCAVSYSKAGTDEVVGTNRNIETCKSILKSIQYNLETSKWSCRSVQSALVTTSQEAVIR